MIKLLLFILVTGTQIKLNEDYPTTLPVIDPFPTTVPSTQPDLTYVITEVHEDVLFRHNTNETWVYAKVGTTVSLNDQLRLLPRATIIITRSDGNTFVFDRIGWIKIGASSTPIPPSTQPSFPRTRFPTTQPSTVSPKGNRSSRSRYDAPDPTTQPTAISDHYIVISIVGVAQTRETGRPWVPIYPGMTLAVGDEIRCNPNTCVNIRRDDGVEIHWRKLGTRQIQPRMDDNGPQINSPSETLQIRG
jgi:hypothetical protein